MIKVNLIGQNHRRESARRRAIIGFVAMLILVAGISAGYTVSVERSLLELRQEGESVEARAREVQAMRKKIATLETQRKTIQPLLEALQRLHRQRALAPGLLNALRTTIPDEAWLLEIRLVDGQLVLVGISPSESVSALFVEKLRETELFSEVTLSKVTQRVYSDVMMQEFVIKGSVAQFTSSQMNNSPDIATAKGPA